MAVLGWSNSRTTSGAKLVSVDCGQSMAEKRSPACQSRKPDEVEAGAVGAAAVIAGDPAGQAPQHQQLDLGDLVEIDQRGRGRRVAHGIGTSATTSAMTWSVVSPCAAACGPSQMRCPSTNGASAWMSSG